MAQTSTAISDLVLAITSCFCLLTMKRSGSFMMLLETPVDRMVYAIRNLYACSSLSFLFITVAAMLGVFRFGVTFPSRRCLTLHSFFSWIATVVGMPLIAVEYNFIYSPYVKTCVSILLVTSGITIMLWRYVSSDIQELLSITLSGISLLSIGVISFLYSISWHGLYGAILVAASGLVLNQPSGWLGFPSVDWFHYIFSVGVYFLKIGMYD